MLKQFADEPTRQLILTIATANVLGNLFTLTCGHELIIKPDDKIDWITFGLFILLISCLYFPFDCIMDHPCVLVHFFFLLLLQIFLKFLPIEFGADEPGLLLRSPGVANEDGCVFDKLLVGLFGLRIVIEITVVDVCNKRGALCLKQHVVGHISLRLSIYGFVEARIDLIVVPSLSILLIVFFIQ